LGGSARKKNYKSYPYKNGYGEAEKRETKDKQKYGIPPSGKILFPPMGDQIECIQREL